MSADLFPLFIVACRSSRTPADRLLLAYQHIVIVDHVAPDIIGHRRDDQVFGIDHGFFAAHAADAAPGGDAAVFPSFLPL